MCRLEAKKGPDVRELTEWWREIDGASRQWLLLGKGPSFEMRGQYDLRPYTTVAINHVVRELSVDVMSAVNFEVVGDCSEYIDRNCRYLLMPRYPHTIPGDGPALLETYFETYPILEKLDREGRLVWYNLSSDTQFPGSPTVQNAAFSVCILFNLFGLMGGRRIRTLGVDGGLSYGNSFADIAERTRLANGMSTYDHQFKCMMSAVKRYKLRYRPLNEADRGFRLKILWHLLRQYVRTDLGRAQRKRRAGEADPPAR